MIARRKRCGKPHPGAELSSRAARWVSLERLGLPRRRKDRKGEDFSLRLLRPSRWNAFTFWRVANGRGGDAVGGGYQEQRREMKGGGDDGTNRFAIAVAPSIG
jgi:hypothetical protein